MDTMILIVQIAAVALPAAWLTTGALENLFHPFLNETYTAEVMDMARMREDYPEAYALVSYRRLTNPKLRKLLFRVIVAWELAATAVLWIGVGALVGSLIGSVDADLALTWALAGALMFSATWGGFLVVGNWFCYWFGHEGGQNTHFQMLLWGIGTMLLLICGA